MCVYLYIYMYICIVSGCGTAVVGDPILGHAGNNLVKSVVQARAVDQKAY